MKISNFCIMTVTPFRSGNYDRLICPSRCTNDVMCKCDDSFFEPLDSGTFLWFCTQQAKADDVAIFAVSENTRD